MWIDPKTGELARTHADIRLLRPNWSAPAVLTDQMIAAVKPPLLPVAQLAPVYDQVTQAAEELPPVLVAGTYTQAWKIIELPADQVAANRAAILEAEREAVDAYLVEVRDMRERLLNRLAGIGAAAIVSGDTDTQKAFVQARQRLLDITKIPDALAAYQACDLFALEAAVKKEYAAIVADVPPSLKNAFYEVDA